MAAYGGGPYGGGNYSYGVSVGEFAVLPESSATVDAYRFTFGAANITSVSSLLLNAQRTAFISFEGLDASAVVMSTNVITSTDLLINSSSILSAAGVRYAVGIFSVNAQSSGSTTARLKWENYGDTAEAWTQIPDTSETWQPIA